MLHLKWTSGIRKLNNSSHICSFNNITAFSWKKKNLEKGFIDLWKFQLVIAKTVFKQRSNVSHGWIADILCGISSKQGFLIDVVWLTSKNSDSYLTKLWSIWNGEAINIRWDYPIAYCLCTRGAVCTIFNSF